MSGLKVRWIQLENFKGFREAHARPESAIDVDADIVLLTGPNGYGKTSLLEAIEVVFTGKIRQRVGDESDIEISDLINKYSGADKARIIAVSNQGTFEVEVNGRRIYSSFQEQRLGKPPFDNPDFIRFSTFFYQEDLDNLFGVRLEVRNTIVNLFIPKVPHEDTIKNVLIKDGQGLLEHKIAALRGKLGEDPEHIRRDIQQVLSTITKAAAKLPEALRPPSIRFRKDLSTEEVATLLWGWLSALQGRDSSSEVRLATTAEVLAEIHTLLTKRYLRRLEELQAKREASLKATGGPLGVLIDRVRRLPEFIPTAQEIEKQINELRRELEALPGLLCELERKRLQMRCLLYEPEEPWSPGREERIATGEIPLLLSIIFLQQTLGANEWQTLADRVGLNTEDKDYKSLLERAEARLTALEKEYLSLEQRFLDLKAKEAKLHSLQDLLARLKEVEEAWQKAGLGEMPVIVTDAGHVCPRSMIEPRIMQRMTAEQQDASRIKAHFEEEEEAWKEVLDGVKQWQNLEEKLRVAEAAADPSLRSRLQAVEQLSKGIGRSKARLNNMFQEARAALLRPYTHQINATVGRILKRFRLPQDIQERFCVRIDNLNIMRYRLEARDGQPERNAFSTFSTGQLNQVGVSLMLALNLGAGENHPLGFICFDDISAAFDPSNLTASALLFRALAYDRRGPQKQIFITSHHDDTTTRLLPLLLPPEGCRMKVIEFLPWSETHGAKVKCYDVAGASKNWKEQLRHLSLPSSKSQPRS